MSPDPSEVEKVLAWSVPSSTREVQYFLRFSSYYRQFIQHFGLMAKPLYRLTECNAKFQWTKEAETTFDELRCRLSSSLILAHPDFKRQFLMNPDASDMAVKLCCLSKVMKGERGSLPTEVVCLVRLSSTIVLPEGSC